MADEQEISPAATDSLGNVTVPAGVDPEAAPSQEMPPDNPYSQFLTDGEFASQAPIALSERFQRNAADAFYRGTIMGAGGAAAVQALGNVDEDRRIKQNLDAYDHMPGSEGFLDHGAAILGQIAGSIPTPESFIGGAAKGATALGRMARAGGTQAVVNLATDPVVQGLNIYSGLRDEYSVTQTALSPLIGFAVGGGLQGLGEAGRLLLTRPKPSAAPAPGVRGDAPVPPAAVVAPEAVSPVVGTPSEAIVATAQAPATGEARIAAMTDAPAAIGDELAARYVAEAPEVRAMADAPVSTEPRLGGETARPMAVTTAEGSLPRQSAPSAQARASTDEAIPAPNIRELWQGLARDVGAPAVRQGRMAIKGARGEYSTKSGAIRLRNIDDPVVLAHEIGHWLEEDFGRPMKTAMQAHAGELGSITQYAQGQASPGDRISEGFAEFIRLHVENPAEALKRAPNFAQAFEKVVANKPAVRDALLAARRGLDAYRAAPAMDLLRANIVDPTTPSAWGRFQKERRNNGLSNAIASRAHAVYAGIFDKNHVLNRTTRALIKLQKVKAGNIVDVKAADDPSKLIALSTNSFNAGLADLMDGVVPYHSVGSAGPSLHDAIALASGKPNLFSGWDDAALKDLGNYLIARRALHEWDRFRAKEIDREPTPFDEQVYRDMITAYEGANANARPAADMVHEWTRNLLAKEFEAGLLTREAYDGALNKPDYVPLMRDMTDKSGGEPTARAGGTDAAKAGLKRFRGSSRPIINPLNSLMDRAFRSAQLIAHNDAIRALAALADRAGVGAAAFVERVPAHEIRATYVDPLEAVKKAALDGGMSKVDADALVTQVSNDISINGQSIGPISLFRSEQAAARGENLIFYRDGGELKALRLKEGQFGRDLADSLTGGLSQPLRDWNLRAVQGFTAVTRAGITTSIPFLVTNFLRDQMSSWILNRGTLPLIDSGRGIWREITSSELAKAYGQVGGISPGANFETQEAARAGRELQSLAKKGYLVSRISSFSGLIRMVDLAETGTRLGIFERALKRGKKQGLSDYEAAVEAAFQARDYIDFSRSGARIPATIKLVPFLNAALQGLDKSFRTLAAPAFREALTAGDIEAQKTMLSAWAKIGVLSGLGMALRAAYIDDPEYDEISEYLRNTHWMVKVPGLKGGTIVGPDGQEIETPKTASGVWVAVPKPFELAIIPNLGERAVEMLWKRDPEALTKWARGALDLVMPPHLLEASGIKLSAELMTGTNMFTGNEIVPDYLKGLEPWMQASAGTSEIAKGIARAGHAVGVDLSPMVIDHVITSTGASWGRDLLALTDVASGAKPASTLTTAPITQRLFKDAYRGAASTTEFWDQVSRSTGELSQAAATYDYLAKSGKLAEAETYVARLSDDKRAYVTLNKSEFDADAKRLHPLRRAQDAIGVLGGMNKEIAGGRLESARTGETIDLTPTERRIALDTLSRIRMWEARNGLIAAGMKGYAGKDPGDVKADIEFLRDAMPTVHAELANRYAAAKVLSFDAVQAVWREMKTRLLEDGSEARVRDVEREAASAGYELGANRRRETKRKRPVIEGINGP